MENLFAKKIAFKKEGPPFGWGASPDADWKTIFLATLLLVLIVGAWDVMTYFKVESGALTESAGLAENEPLTLDKASLKSTAAYYQAKAREFERIIGAGASPVVDPSL